MPFPTRAEYEVLIYGLPQEYPDHRHEPPDLKHNRKPASGITFQAPNLPTLIADCVELGKTLQAE